MGKWLFWDGTRWQIEQTLAMFDIARQICREAAAQSDNSATLLKTKTSYAVEVASRSDRRVAATDDQWDVDKVALNVSDGENSNVP